MYFYLMLPAFFYIVSAYTASALIPPNPTASAGVNTAHVQHSLTTPPQRLPTHLDLRRRDDSPGRTCGWFQEKDGSFSPYPWTVSSPYYCAGTILPDGSAYAYSSDAEVGAQYKVWTTAVGDWDSKKRCPTESSTTCCSGDNPIVQTYYFTGGPYTMTSWWCSTTKLTQTWVPKKNLLETKAFSISLARATASSAAGASSGLSSDTKIGIGVGVAVGVGVILFAGAVFCLWRRRHRRAKADAKAASQAPYHQGAPYDPQYHHNLQAWHDNPTYAYYKQDIHASPWPASPSRGVRLQELHGLSRTEEAQELSGGAKTATSPEQQREQPRHELGADYI